MFLKVLPPDIGRWEEVTERTRAKYNELKQHYVTDPHQTHGDVELSVNNPLSQEEEVRYLLVFYLLIFVGIAVLFQQLRVLKDVIFQSPWNQYFQDNELRKEIMQDLTRT